MDCTDWKLIKAEYIAGGTSYRKLAEKYGVKMSALRSVAEREKWVELKAQAQHKTDSEIVKSVSKRQAKQAVGIIKVADRLLKRIEKIAASDNIGAKDIKNLTSALKDLREIKGIKSDSDVREQEARIRKLEREAEREDGKEMPEFSVVGLPEEFRR